MSKEKTKEDLQMEIIKLKEEVFASRVKEQTNLQKTISEFRENEQNIKAIGQLTCI